MLEQIFVQDEHRQDYEDVLEHLRGKGIRITETRKAIVAYMIHSHAHPSAEMIYKELLPLYPNMSLATVYNNLKVLIEEGFVAEIKISNDQATYFDFMGHQHLNVICENCGNIADLMNVEVPDVKKEAEKETGYRITKTQMLIYGICPDCQES